MFRFLTEKVKIIKRRGGFDGGGGGGSIIDIWETTAMNIYAETRARSLSLSFVAGVNVST